MKEGNTKVLNVSISPRGKKIKRIKQWARLGKNSGSVPNALESCLAGEGQTDGVNVTEHNYRQQSTTENK